MSQLNNILKPKSKEDLNRDIRKMSAFEFVYTFNKFKIKDLKIGFKKRLAYYLLSSRGLYKYNKYYWVIWGIWFIIMMGDLIFPEDGFFQRNSIVILEKILWIIIMVYFVIMIPGIFLLIKYGKWCKAKHDNYIQNRVQEMVEQAANIINDANTPITEFLDFRFYTPPLRFGNNEEENNNEVNENDEN